jgi:hypothetical protein
MVTHIRARLALGVLACGTLMLAAGCKKENKTVPDTTTAAGAVITPAPAPAVISVVDVDLGKAIGADKKITDKTDDFAPKDQIFASVHTAGTAPSASLSARWTFEDGSVVDERSENIAANCDAYTEFHIAKPSGWPKGKYTLHLLLYGKEVRTKDFTVK